MKKYIPIILVLSIIKLIVQWLGNRNYGFHRDELLHLSVSEHLDWGFMEFPPFIALIGKLSYWCFDYSLLGVRLFPTLAGIGILILCCLIAKELGGKSKAILLSGICILAFLPFYRNHTLFQPVAFDQLFWTLGFYFLVKFINSENKKFLFLLGLTLGLGLMNKYTMFVWAFGLFIGLFFLSERTTIQKQMDLYFREYRIAYFLAKHNLANSKRLPASKTFTSAKRKSARRNQPNGFCFSSIRIAVYISDKSHWNCSSIN
jgi:hypothetical protein